MDKKKLLAGTGLALLGIGGFTWEVFTDASKPIFVEAIKPAITKMAKTVIGSNSASEAAASAASSAADAYREADERCADQVAQNPAVDLNDSVAVSEARIRCLLVTENQGAALDALAETDAELKQLLADIRRQLSQPSTVKE